MVSKIRDQKKLKVSLEGIRILVEIVEVSKTISDKKGIRDDL